MIYKGKVLEVKDEYIIVATEDLKYLKLNPKRCRVGKEIIFLEEDIINDIKGRAWDKSIMVAAVMILIISVSILSGNFIMNMNSYAAIVSLDINPSVEFMIDDNDVVKKLKAMNEEGKEIISEDMKGMKIEDAIVEAINNAVKKNYIRKDEDKNIIISMADEEEDNGVERIEKSVSKLIENHVHIEKEHIVYIDSNIENHKKAEKTGVSVGKYEFEKLEKANKESKEKDKNKDKDKSNFEKKREKVGNGDKYEKEDKDKKGDKDKRDNKIKNKNNKNSKNDNAYNEKREYDERGNKNKSLKARKSMDDEDYDNRD